MFFAYSRFDFILELGSAAYWIESNTYKACNRLREGMGVSQTAGFAESLTKISSR